MPAGFQAFLGYGAGGKTDSLLIPSEEDPRILQVSRNQERRVCSVTTTQCLCLKKASGPSGHWFVELFGWLRELEHETKNTDAGLGMRIEVFWLVGVDRYVHSFA